MSFSKFKSYNDRYKILMQSPNHFLQIQRYCNIKTIFYLERNNQGHQPLIQTKISYEELLSTIGNLYDSNVGGQTLEANVVVTLLLNKIAIQERNDEFLHISLYCVYQIKTFPFYLRCHCVCRFKLTFSSISLQVLPKHMCLICPHWSGLLLLLFKNVYLQLVR